MLGHAFERVEVDLETWAEVEGEFDRRIHRADEPLAAAPATAHALLPALDRWLTSAADLPKVVPLVLRLLREDSVSRAAELAPMLVELALRVARSSQAGDVGQRLTQPRAALAVQSPPTPHGYCASGVRGARGRVRGARGRVRRRRSAVRRPGRAGSRDAGRAHWMSGLRGPCRARHRWRRAPARASSQPQLRQRRSRARARPRG